MREGPLAALDAIEQGDRRARGQRDRLLPRRHAAGRDARLHGGEGRRRASPARPIFATHDRFRRGRRALASSSTRSSSTCSRSACGARLSRRHRHGDDLQHAARQRPDLVVRRQQLPAGQGALPLRSAVLEQRFDAHAGGDAQLLPAQHVPGEQAGRSRAGSRSTACRSTCARSRRRPSSCRRARTISRRGNRPMRRRRSIAGPVRFVLSASGHIAGVVNPPDAKKYGHWENAKLPKSPDDWLAGATYHEGSWWPTWEEWVARAWRRQGAGAQAGRRQAQADRGRAGLLRQGEGDGIAPPGPAICFLLRRTCVERHRQSA